MLKIITKSSGWFDPSPQAQEAGRMATRGNIIQNGILALQNSPDSDIQAIIKQLQALV